MRKIIWVFITIILMGCARQEKPLRVMSFNIRYNNPDDGADAWPNRKEIAVSMISFHKAELIGIQEALKDQIDDLVLLLPGYSWYGLGRDDGKEAGEFMAVFYSDDRLELLDKSTLWLSPTPDKVSMGWDAACFRTVTVCKFKDKIMNKTFFHFNTHFDHRGEEARRESALLLLTKVQEIARESPLIVTGDFNMLSSSEPYAILTKGEENRGLSPIKDTRLLSIDGHHGPTGTFSGFKEAGTPGRQIDFIFIKNNVTVLRHGILSDTFDGHFPSDHLPVLAEVIIE